MEFASVTEAIEWIHGESGARRKGEKHALDNMRALLRRLGDPQERLRMAHVAGTNGQGSTCAFLESALRACALAHPGVKGIDRLLTRKFGSKMYVEMEISADGNMTLTAAHDIAEGVHNDIERQFPKVKHIMIHVNPA